MAFVELRGINKLYGRTHVVHDVHAEFEKGEFVVILGPSGCGKSTLLRMIAGLEEVSWGEIHIAGRRVDTLAPKDRGCAMVFQNYALYPHLRVAGNIGYGLRVAGMPRKERQAKIEEVARMLQIDHLLDRKPGQLSGGQRQRVAIARAIAREPGVFLFDEPLSNLDAKLRTAMRIELRRLHDRIGATSIFVTHDQVEAMTLADKIVVIDQGRIAQMGTPHDIYHEPQSRFVADFIGSPAINIFDATVQVGGVTAVTSFGLELPVDGLVPGNESGSRITLGIRPENLTIGDQGLPATLEHIEDMGNQKVLFCRVDGCEVRIVEPGDRTFAAGTAVGLMVRNNRVVVFDRELDGDGTSGSHRGATSSARDSLPASRKR